LSFYKRRNDLPKPIHLQLADEQKEGLVNA